MTRTIALVEGCDWADAACTHLEVPDDLTFEAAYKEWSDWYYGQYVKTVVENKVAYESFVDFLKRKYGAVESHMEVWDRT